MEGKISPLKKPAILCLPSSICDLLSAKLKQLSLSESAKDDKFECITQELLNNDSKNHLALLKKVTLNIETYSSTSIWPVFIEVIINGLYYCHTNHIVKSSINGVMRHLSSSDAQLVSRVLEEKLQLAIQNNSCQMNLIEMLAAFLQSDFGCKVIVNHSDTLIEFFTAALDGLSNELTMFKPTTEVVQLHANIHSLSRTLLSIVKLADKCVSKEKSLELVNSVITTLNSKEILLDAQGNCAKILVILLKNHPEGFKWILSRIAGTHCDTQNTLVTLEHTTRIRINLSNAILSSLELADLVETHQPNETLLGGVILKTLLQTSEGLNGTEVALLIIRFLEQWQRKCFECLIHHPSAPTHSLLILEWRAASGRLLEMALNGLEHQIDAVRHTAKEAFFQNIKTNIFLKSNVDYIVKTILDMPRFKKSKYIALACLAKTELSPLIIKLEPRIPEELLDIARDLDLSSQAKEAFNLLMFQPTDVPSLGVERWLFPLLGAMEKNPSMQSFESSFIELLKMRPYILNSVEVWCQSDPSSRLSVYISALLASRKLGFLPDISSREEITCGKTNILQQALEHSDDKLRINALHVIIEGPKTTQLYSTLEVELVRRFISKNMDNPNASFRQQLCSSVKKFLLRLQNGGIPLIGRNDMVVNCYRKFVTWFVDKCFVSLGPGSSFSRRYLSLSFLKLIHETVGLQTDPNSLNAISAIDLSAITSLADCFFDSYDVNKELALELLLTNQLLAVAQQDLRSAKLMDFYWKMSLQLSQGLKSTDIVAAGFFLRWLVHVRPAVDSEANGEDWSPQSANALNTTNISLTALKGQLDKARGNLCSLAVDAPLYGLLSSIRLILIDQQSRSGGSLKHQAWKNTLAQVVTVCFDASAIASPVVTCDSPEGFLPDNTVSSASYVNAQALLVSAWRTVKEVALLFGQLSVWIINEDILLADNQVLLKVGLHLKQLLLETKHRGAFEQVHCGFSQLIYALWRSSKPELNKLPSIWLHEIIEDIKLNESSTKLCSTRRSAGLPFIFQAILAPEIELGRGELFDHSVKSLLDIASEGGSESKIHALNILRNLYRESRLNQVIGPYVARGLMLSILGFEAQDWSERNSSTLLFSALMTRIFGVARSKSDFQKKNSLTGRVFFQTYPVIYSFLLERLTSVAEDIDEGGIHLHPSLFPMLVLLGRLQPPACEFFDSAFKLEPFVPLIRRCGSSPVLKARQLAAQALTSLMSPDVCRCFIPEVLNSTQALTSHNKLHGDLLQIRYFLQDFPQSCETRDVIAQVLLPQTQLSVNLLKNKSCLIRYELANILEILNKENAFSPQVWQIVHETCQMELKNRNLVLYSQPFYPLACQKLTSLLMPGIVSVCESAVVELFNHPLQEVKLMAMEYLSETGSLENIIGLSSTLQSIVADKTQSTECRSKALKLLVKTSPSTSYRLDYCLTLFNEATDNRALRCAALEAAGRVILFTDSSENLRLLVEWSGHLLEAIEDEVQFRLVVIESIASCSKLLLIEENHQTNEEQGVLLGTLLINLWTCLLYCLIDDDNSVRSIGATVVASFDNQAQSSMHSTIALGKALQYLVNRIYKFYPTEVLKMLTGAVLEEQEQPEGDSPSFEKGDSDAYREPLTHSIIFCRYIGRCVVQKPVRPLDLSSTTELVENRWTSLEDDFVMVTDLLTSCQRFYVVQLIQLFLLSKSLAPLHEKMVVISQTIRQRFELLTSGHWLTYSAKKLVL